MDRREFLTTSLAAGAFAPLSHVRAEPLARPAHASDRFRLRYAPHFGMFRQHAGDALIDQIRFMADAGFSAIEDHGLLAKPPGTINAIGRELKRRNMTMGRFVAHPDYGDPTFASGRCDLQDRVLSDMRRAVDVAARVGARYCTVVPGKLDRRLPLSEQTAHAVDLLRSCIDVIEPAGLTLLLEPLHHATHEPSLFMHDMNQARLLCRAVGHPCCRILFDVYHERVAGRDPWASLLSVWDDVGYIQVGDNPGRKEPGSGTIDYRRLFSFLDALGYTGPVGMEHGNSAPGKAGEQNVIAAYQTHDPR